MLTLLAACGGEDTADSPQPPTAPLAAAPAEQERAPDRPVTGSATAEDGVSIVFDALGTGDTALVFVHGWACNRQFWRHQFAAFAPDYRVIALDLGGHGDSGSGRDAWTIPVLAGDVAAVVRQLDLKRVVLVGHSMGGPVSLEAARLLPGRVVAVIGADTLHDAEVVYEPAQIDAFIGAFEEDFVATLTGMFNGMSGAQMTPELQQWVVDEAANTPPEVAIGLLRSYSAVNIPQMLSDAGVPVRVIQAQAGGAIPETRVETNRKYADFDAVVVPGVGHFLQLQDPLSFNRELRALLAGLDPA